MKHSIPTEVQGTFIMESNIETHEFDWLIVGFHGFGELAEKQMQRMTSAEWPGATLFCSIQALHPMYNKDGSPGASWMTFFNRDQVIRDNLNYVRNVISHLEKSNTWSKLAFCGFSQGASMAHRATYDLGTDCDLLVTAGGDIPPELRELDLSGYPQTVIARGVRDRIYLEETYLHDVALMDDNGVGVNALSLKGGHKWPVALTEYMASLTAPVSFSY